MIPKGFQGTPTTIGEHVHKKRLALGLTQTEVSEIIGVTYYTIRNWERGKCKPQIKDFPSITRFLGYEVLPEASTIPEKLRRERTRRGWSIKVCTQKLDIEEWHIRAWEAGKTILPQHQALVAEFLGIQLTELAETGNLR